MRDVCGVRREARMHVCDVRRVCMCTMHVVPRTTRPSTMALARLHGGGAREAGVAVLLQRPLDLGAARDVLELGRDDGGVLDGLAAALVRVTGLGCVCRAGGSGGWNWG